MLDNYNKHSYTLVSTGLSKDVDKTFSSRENANKYMYNLMQKNHLRTIEVYDDKHDKTYKCNDRVTFFIQRF